MMPCVLKEMGLEFEFSEKLQVKLGNQWHTAKKLSPARLLSVLALSQLVDEYNGIGMTALSCVDAIPGLGIAGALWKSLFGEKVKVVVNKFNLECNNTNNNGADLNVDSNCKFVQLEPNSLLRSGGVVNFIYLEAYGNCVEYFESACRVISHRGIVCIVSTDLSTLYNKSPDRVRRIYHGYTMKNEYVKETAVRLILANLARAASRYTRGISVLFSYIDGDSVVIAARILKGAGHADQSLDMVKKIAHCRECQYRHLFDEKRHFNPPADISNCFCIDAGLVGEGILPPIVLLGPVYCGPIFVSNFLFGMKQYLVALNPKHKIISVLQSMIVESFCCVSNCDETTLLEIIADNSFTNNSKSKAADEPPPKKSKTTESFQEFAARCSNSNFPVLFSIAQTHVAKGCNPPKILDIINKLRSEGYKASRTIFDPRGIRTSASLKDFRRLMATIAKESPMAD